MSKYEGIYNDEFFHKLKEARKIVNSLYKEKNYNTLVYVVYFKILYYVLHSLADKLNSFNENKMLDLPSLKHCYKSYYDYNDSKNFPTTHELYISCYVRLTKDRVFVASDLNKLRRLRNIANYSLDFISQDDAKYVKNIHDKFYKII
jgi:hypothetical protein